MCELQGVQRLDMMAETVLDDQKKISETQENSGLLLSNFTDEAHDTTFHFQILVLTDQLYVWVSCNSARLGSLYAAAPTPYSKTPSLAVLLGGGADTPGASCARRLALKTGWSIVLASNIPAKSPTLEAFAEKRLLQQLRALGYVKHNINITQE